MTRRGPLRPRLIVAVLAISAGVLALAPAAIGSTTPPTMAPPIRHSSLPPAKPVPAKSETSSLSIAGQAAGTDPAVRELKPNNSFSLAVFRWQSTKPDSIQWRSRTETGVWSVWRGADAEDAGPDTKTAHDVSEPVWTGPASRIQVKAVKGGAPVTQQLSVVTINPGTSTNDTMVSGQAGSGVPSQPTVVSRAQWGADESKMTWTPEYTETVKAAALHHTANSNDYTCDQSASMVRGIYYAHAVTNGWGDIGYNALVDKCGTVFEGRTGGLSLPTIGAHTIGFNRYVFGISMIGDYNAIDVPAPQLESVAQMMAWKLSNSYDDPSGTVTLTSGGPGSDKYPPGTVVTFPTIFGHRDAMTTDCPGSYGYADLPALRTRVTTLSGDWKSSPVYQKWQAVGGGSAAGPAYRLETSLSDGGRSTTFASDGSAITWRSDLDAHWIHGAIYSTYKRLGGYTTYGDAATDENGTPDGVGRYNHLSASFGASIYWTPNTGAHAVQGAIRGEWSNTGWETGPAGYPTTDESGTPDGVGRYNHFTGDGMAASIYWSPNSGAHLIQGVIRSQWSSMGWETSWLGYPTSDEYGVSGGRRTDFQGGYIRYDFGTGVATAYRY